MKTKQNSRPLLITDTPVREPSRDEIARAAYSIWEREGHAQGRELEHWLQAEVQFRQPAQQGAAQV